MNQFKPLDFGDDPGIKITFALFLNIHIADGTGSKFSYLVWKTEKYNIAVGVDEWSFVLKQKRQHKLSPHGMTFDKRTDLFQSVPRVHRSNRFLDVASRKHSSPNRSFRRG